MNAFDTSNWAKAAFSAGYRDNADMFIVERRRMLAILQSFYLHFVKRDVPRTMLDLGCGDGIVTAAIAGVDDMVAATLVDGSYDMLAKAQERLKGLKYVRFMKASFQDMLREDLPDQSFDFVASSLAIHHLSMDEKVSLFRYAYDRMKPGGGLVNIDVVLAPSPDLEQWYLALWKDWINGTAQAVGITDGRYNHITQQYKNAEENKPDTLQDQLQALKKIGFQDVDCFYQYGIFTVFGGRKPEQ